MKIKSDYSNEPQWKEVTVKSTLPKELACLDEIAHNMWWAWNYEARNMFKALDEVLYEEVGHNPVQLLERLSYDRKEAIVKDKKLMKQVGDVYKKFRSYMDVKPDSKRASVAYFCMEFGLNQTLKIYSGGLGMLAGDYLKEASDSNVDLCAVGFLYRFGYFTQSLSMDGQQIAKYDAQNFNSLPIERELDENGNQVVVDVPYRNYQVHALVWRVNVGRIKLYLLDTDNDMNSEFDRPITHSLYGGDWENRLKQEILLGIGGMLTLKKLGIKKDIYHCNEGHAALCNLQRLCDYIDGGLTFNQAMELVRVSSLYTVHTPVPAGHDYFDEALFGKYMGDYPAKLGISWDEFIGMGRTNPDDHSERFCMSTFACNTCQEINGVSKLHGWVSQKMFAPLWKGYFPEENAVGYVTNGVHLPTWTATEWRKVYDKYFDKSFMGDQSNEQIWHAIYNVPDAEIWETRMALKQKLIKYIRDKFTRQWLRNQGDPAKVVSILEKINPNALMIGFCRRFATYKRAHLLFTDLDRLEKIVNNPERPVLFFFSGKAHPADGAGQGLIKRIFEISRMPQFLGKIIFLEDYDMQLARRLVSGVDIWMNTPTRPLEASGTSGEKAEMNGVLNLSVLDGWWYEGYRKGAGWALTDKRTFTDQGLQDKLDATTIYDLLEKEILPLYFNRDGRPYSEAWVQTMKNSMNFIAPHYTMRRMMDDYFDRFYTKLAQRSARLHAERNAIAKQLVAWKQSVISHWDELQVISVEDMGSSIQSNSERHTGANETIRLVLDKHALTCDLDVELVDAREDEHGKLCLVAKTPLKLVSQDGTRAVYEISFVQSRPGHYKRALRILPSHPELPHRMDFALVRWVALQ